jgi:hypothetical protein
MAPRPYVRPIIVPPPTHRPVPDLCKDFWNHFKIITLKMATAVFAETLETSILSRVFPNAEIIHLLYCHAFQISPDRLDPIPSVGLLLGWRPLYQQSVLSRLECTSSSEHVWKLNIKNSLNRNCQGSNSWHIPKCCLDRVKFTSKWV